MKIVVITSRVPYPIEKGDKLRIYNQIKELSKSHEVYLFAIDNDNVDQENIQHLKQYCKNIEVYKNNLLIQLWNLFLGLFSNKPFQVHYFYNKAIHRAIEKKINSIQPDIIHCHLIRVSEYVKSMPFKKVLDYMDTFSLGLIRRLNKQPFYLRWLFKLESRRVEKYESSIFDYFDAHTIISEQDRKYIQHPNSNTIKIINNGIADEYLDYPTSDLKKYDILFTGNMSYQPNVDAAIYIASLLPKIKLHFPNIKIAISGVNPSPQVLSLQNENIEVTGWVEDLKAIYATSRILVAPMQIGTGLQNKLLEAMAMRLPCITSKLANNALRAKNGLEILECEQDDEYVSAIIKLMTDQNFSASIANNAYHFVINNYNWKSSVGELENIYQKICHEI